jgi:hypothetical protein
MKKIFATAFITSLTSYGIFALAEYTRPGFVSYHFSLHWFLLLTIVFAVAWVLSMGEDEESVLPGFVGIIAKVILSILLFVLVWKEGLVFNDFRIFLALVAAMLPWMISFGEENMNNEYE